MSSEAGEMKYIRMEKLKVKLYPSREAAGAAAAEAATKALKELSARNNGDLGVIFATGASQIETLRQLVAMRDVPWGRIRGFHMDEYIAMKPDHPASFRRYVRERLTSVVHMKEFFEIDGTAPDPEIECQQYAAKVRAADPKLCLLGIGENGHLAFNDPSVADFEDPKDMKVVELDDACRRQQAAEGWFKSPEEVPMRAMTLTIPTLYRVPKLILSVPGPRKAAIVRRTLEDPISTACPATILRHHPDATVYLDRQSAAELDWL